MAATNAGGHGEGKKPQIWLLCLLISYPPVFGVLFTPGLPDLAAYFGVSAGRAQLTVTTFLVGYALGQLLYGPISNRFGRKQTISIGIGISILGALFCVGAILLHQFALLLPAISIMSIGSCVGLVMTYTVVGDAFSGEAARRILSYVMSSFAIMPGLAVTFGGWLTSRFGWMSCFYFLIVYGVVIFAVCRFLPETLKAFDPHAIRVKRIARAYADTLKVHGFLGTTLVLGFATSTFYVFAAVGPFVAQMLGIMPAQYGLWNLLGTGGFFVGFFVAAKMARRYSAERSVVLGICITLASGLVMLALFLFSVRNGWSMFVPMMGVYFGMAVVAPNTSATATALTPDKSSGSSVMTFIYMSLSVLSVFLVGLLNIQDPVALPLVFVGINVLQFLVNFGTQKKLNTVSL